MKLAIVIVHYNTSGDLDRCLDSLRAHAPACEHAVVVVDNASSDPGLDAVRAKHGHVRWEMSAENLGYSRGANLGMSLVEAAIESARLRFRPILMTAFSFILGIFPLVVASGAGAEARKVMGMALLGGMTLATMLGVFFYPMLFVLIGKLGRYEQKRDQMKETENKP